MGSVIRHAFGWFVMLVIAANAATAQDKSWTIGSGVDPSGPFQVIAEAKGFFDKHGVKVTVRRFSSATQAFRSVQSEEIDAAIPGTLAPISALSQGASNFTIVGSTRPSQNGFSAIVVDAALAAPESLKGKKVAMAQGSAGSHMWFETYAKSKGITDVQRVWLQPQEQVIAFSKKEVDAVAIWFPWASKAIEVRPGARILAKDDDIAYVNDTPIVFGKRLMGNPQAASAMLKALVEADEFLTAQRSESVAIIAKAFNISTAETSAILDTVTLRVQMSEVTFADLCRTTTFLKETGAIKAAPDWKQAVDAAPLRAVAPQRVSFARFIDCQ
jgi:ABC-type nitrate/sulfonate/bicarbonate transport system substrate-binding protein